jgi:hypothetical protein
MQTHVINNSVSIFAFHMKALHVYNRVSKCARLKFKKVSENISAEKSPLKKSYWKIP